MHVSSISNTFFNHADVHVHAHAYTYAVDAAHHQKNILHLLADIQRKHILVIGDVMLDRYWFGDSTRISPEAPVPIVSVKVLEERLGGAANVARNMANLGVQTHLLSSIGEDDVGVSLLKNCAEAGIHTHLQHNPHPTTLKLRVLARQQQMLRLDFEHPITESTLTALQLSFINLLERMDLIVLSDYKKGIFTHSAHLQNYIQLSKQLNKKVLVDPKGDDFSHYQQAYLLTPNRKEFEQIVGSCSDESILIEKGHQLREKLQLNALLLTRSEEGMTLFTEHGCQHYPAKAREVFDVSGAGDTVIATLAAFLAAGASLEDAVYYANCAGGVVVAKLGTSTVSLAEIQQAI